MVYDVSFVASGACVRARERVREWKIIRHRNYTYIYKKKTLAGFLYAEKKKKEKKSTGARANGNGIYIRGRAYVNS